MLEWLAKYWLEWLFALMGSGVLALATYVRGRLKRIDALEKAARASLYDRLYYLYGKFMQQGWVPVKDFENITGIYEGYHGLGGNGVGTELYEELSELPKFEPKPDDTN